MVAPCTGWRGCIGRLIFIGHYLQKSPIISGSSVERYLQLKAFEKSSPPFRHQSQMQAEKSYFHFYISFHCIHTNMYVYTRSSCTKCKCKQTSVFLSFFFLNPLYLYTYLPFFVHKGAAELGADASRHQFSLVLFFNPLYLYTHQHACVHKG